MYVCTYLHMYYVCDKQYNRSAFSNSNHVFATLYIFSHYSVCFLLLFSWVVVVVALPFSFLGRRKITDNKCHEKYQYNNKVQDTPSIIDDLYG